MPKVNYINEHRAINEYAARYHLPSTERLLWQALFDIFNASAKGEEWPEGYVCIRAKELTALTGKSADSVNRARAKLERRGLIAYRPGKGALEPAGYCLNYLTVYGEPETQERLGVEISVKGVSAGQVELDINGEYGGECEETVRNAEVPTQNAEVPTQNAEVPTQNAEVPTQNAGVNTEYVPEGEYKPYKQINEDEEEYNNNNIRGRKHRAEYKTLEGNGEESLAEELRQRFREATGRIPMPSEVETIEQARLDVQQWRRADRELALTAVTRAAAAGATNVAGYAAKLLADWGEKAITDLYELTTYEKYKHLSETSLLESDKLERFQEQLYDAALTRFRATVARRRREAELVR